MLQQGGAAGAIEAHLRHALEVARQQHNRSLELRAALALTRLSHAAAARQVLEGVYSRFSEGFETPDLIETKALLEEAR
jgi:hypothetical protein